jgi:hypothetical protein
LTALAVLNIGPFGMPCHGLNGPSLLLCLTSALNCLRGDLHGLRSHSVGTMIPKHEV